MRNSIKKILIAFCVLIAVAVLYNVDTVKAAITAPAIEVSKTKYDEENNELFVGIYIKPRTVLTNFNLTLGFDSSQIQIIPYTNGATQTGGITDIQVMDDSPFDLYVNYSSTDISIVSDVKDSEISILNKQKLCEVRFKLKGSSILEEELSNDLFSVDIIEIADDDDMYDGDTYDKDDLITINPMAKVISGISITNASFDKSEYRHNDTVNLVAGTATISYTNVATPASATRVVDLATTTLPIKKGPWIADYNNPYVIIEYKGVKSNPIAINVVDWIESIRFQEPSKKLYNYGEKLDITNSKIYIKMASKTNEIEKTLQELISNGKANITGFDSTLGPKQMITQTVTVNINYPEYNYIDVKTFDVNILDYINNISFNPQPTKIKYEYDTELDVSGGKILITYLSNSVDEISITKDMVTEQDNSNFDSTILGTRDLKVTYTYTENGQVKNKTLNYEITVYDVITKIEWITKPQKDKYEYGTELDVTGGEILLTYKSGNTKEVNVTKDMVTEQDDSNFDSTILGTRDLKVTYTYTENGQSKSKTLNYEITVYDFIKEINIITPTKTVYEYGESNLDLSGGKVIIKMASGEIIERNLISIPLINKAKTLNKLQANINLDDKLEVNGFDSSKPGKQTITLIYYYEENGLTKSKTTTYDIYINHSIKLNDDNMTIKYGHIITDKDLENYKIIIGKAGNNIEEINITADMLRYNPYGSIGTQTAYVVYKYSESGQIKTKEIPIYITLENYIDYIKLSHKNITVNYGDELGNDTLTEEYKIIPVMANGEIGTAIRLTKDKIVGVYNTREEGVYRVKVEYDGKYTDFEIIVVDPILGIKLEDKEKEKIDKLYKYGEELNLNEAQLTIVRISGEYKTELTREMIEGYEPKKLGEQILDVEYMGQRLEQALSIKVEDYAVDIILVKPNKVTYLPREELNLTGATVQVLMASGMITEPIAVNMEMISGYDVNTMGVQKLTVTYEEFEKTFEIIRTVQTGLNGLYIPEILIGIICIASIGIVIIFTINKTNKKGRKRGEK